VTSKLTSWRVVATQECRDLWLGGRGPVLLFALSLLLSAITYFAGTSQILNFLEQREAVNLTLQIAVAVGVLITLVVSADAISGERERGTLESLLLTPVSRRAISLGKLIAALSIWLGAFIVTVPYLWALGHGVSLVAQAVVLGFLTGTLLAAGLGSVGVLISARSGSNKVSISVSIFMLLALFAPSQLPVKGTLGEVLSRLNPVASALRYLTAVVVNGHHWTRDLSFLISPIALAVMASAVLIGLSPRLIQLFTVLGLLLGTSLALPAPAAHAAPAQQVDVTFDQAQLTVEVGDRFTLHSHVASTEPMDSLLAHLNIASLTTNVYVDPEDWSAERTQVLDPLQPGEKTAVSWAVQAVNAGTFDLYVVLLPANGNGPLTVSTPVHVTVTTKQTLSAGGSLPVVIVMPVLLGATWLAIQARTRRRQAS
jgi:ABC-2 type transport system permease protein